MNPGKSMRPCAVTWHEAIAGRSAEEICSALLLFIISHRDVENLIFGLMIAVLRTNPGFYIPCASIW